VRTTSKGAKSFVFEGKLNRKTIRITLGDVLVWGIEEARDPVTNKVLIPGARQEARRLQSLLDQGIDPRELELEKKEKKAADKAAKAEAERIAKDRQRYTLKALLETYIKHLEAQGKGKSAAAAASAFKCHVLEPHPEISNTPASEVSALQLAAIVRQVFEQGKERTAGVLRSYLSAAYNAAKKAPFRTEIPSALIPFDIEHNPVEPVGSIPVKAGHRHLSADELKKYLDALGDDLNDLALKLALYAGGQRMAQLLRAKVTDYDPETKILRLLDGKGSRKKPRMHELPLGLVAAGIAGRLLQDAERADSIFLFASRGSAVHHSTPGKRVKEISDAIAGEPFDLRDIRRTVETMLAGLGVSKDDRAQLLSHGLSGVQEKHYDRNTYLKEKRAALLKWERHLKNIITAKTASKVVNLRGA
jgi:integrase